MSSELKTQKTKASVSKFLDSVEHEQRKADAKILLKLFEEVTKEKAIMWGDSIIGFGEYTYRRKNEKIDRDWMKVGFSPRKTSMSIYILSGFDSEKELLSKLGKYKTGSCCLYVNKLEDIDLAVLKKLIQKGYKSKVFMGQC